MVYLIFMKAFNTVSHNIVLENLVKYGLGEQAHLARLFSVVPSDRARCKGHN